MNKKISLSKFFCFYKNLKNEKGSVVTFVTVSCIFILAVLVTFFINLGNQRMSQKKQIDKIVQQYEVTQQDMERTYQEKSVNVNGDGDE